MKKFFNEFKTFAMRGNVMDMAIGVVIGAAFGKITTSIVNDIIMPLIGLLTGGIDLAKWNILLNSAAVEAGDIAPERFASYQALKQETATLRTRREEARRMRGEKASDKKRAARPAKSRGKKRR